MKVYFANSLFNDADRMYNMYVVDTIRAKLNYDILIYNPMENDEINDKDEFADAQMVANADYEQLRDSDLLIAVLDSGDVGVGVEIGLAYEMGIPIIGVYTDVRQKGSDNKDKVKALSEIGQNQFSYVNIMQTGLIMNNGVMVDNTDDLIKRVIMFNEEYKKVNKWKSEASRVLKRGRQTVRKMVEDGSAYYIYD